MPPLLNVPSCPPQLFISNTNPPFIYQRIGDQIKVLQVLDNVDNVQIIESKELSKNDKTIFKSDDVAESLDGSHKLTKDIPLEPDNDSHKSKDSKPENVDVVDAIEIEKEDKFKTVNKDENKSFETAEQVKDDLTDCTSIETSSLLESYSADSDDEASFGTPDNSPRTKRKLSPRVGRYGKSKAPPPPRVISDDTDRTDEENLTDYIRSLPDSTLAGVFTNDSKVLNPIVENKMRHKSKSPHRSSKRNSSTIGKLLQIPGKIAFWNKEKSKSDSSENNSRRSSTVDFQSVTELNAETSSLFDDQISFKDAVEIDEQISKEIIDKSDELKKLIEAKLESHPEYKMISLHEDMVGSSKSTDV